jgi:hypothetical protein
MGKPTWRSIGTVKVPDSAGRVWTPAWDWITAGKLYLIEVTGVAPASAVWTPESGSACGPDGDPGLTRNSALTIDTCAPGALIGKIGGGTADVKADKDKVVLFGIGRRCVFSISDAAKAGPLYLGMNDTLQGASKFQGHLDVTISEAL